LRSSIANGLERKDKISKIESHFREIMSTLGLDLTDDSLIEVSDRVAKMYVQEIFWGLIMKLSVNVLQ